MTIQDLLARAVSLKASDIHLKPNQKPFFRVDGDLVESDVPAMSPDDLGQMVEAILPAHLKKSFAEQHEADFSYHVEAIGRFRVNVFFSQGEPSLALRHVKTRIPSFEELTLPPALKDLALSPRGIIIISGPTGSGKSTTLAAMIEHINLTQRSRIITIEDPIEYLFTDDHSLITQREVGIDTVTFHGALKRVIRQDPDVIVIGEMRDETSFRVALSAAETGHLLMTTLHAGTAPLAVYRLLEFFPAGEREQIRMALAGNLRAVICQRLMTATKGGVVPAVEVMINTPTVRKLLEKDRLDMLSAAIETGTDDGMQTFNQAIYKLIRSGTVTEKEGMYHSTNPAALRMNLQGVFLDESRRILAT
jgi:twitching motility protein PilT